MPEQPDGIHYIAPSKPVRVSSDATPDVHASVPPSPNVEPLPERMDAKTDINNAAGPGVDQDKMGYPRGVRSNVLPVPLTPETHNHIAIPHPDPEKQGVVIAVPKDFKHADEFSRFIHESLAKEQ